MTKKLKNVKTEKPKKKGGFAFPASLIRPVANFLSARLHKLEKRKKEVEREDPFKDTSRVLDNASPDTDAAEQFGHASNSAVRRQLDRAIIQTRKALTRVKLGKYGICEVCGRMIDTDRLVIYPDATLCAEDAAKREK